MHAETWLSTTRAKYNQTARPPSGLRKSILRSSSKSSWQSFPDFVWIVINYFEAFSVVASNTWNWKMQWCASGFSSRSLAVPTIHRWLASFFISDSMTICGWSSSTFQFTKLFNTFNSPLTQVQLFFPTQYHRQWNENMETSIEQVSTKVFDLILRMTHFDPVRSTDLDLFIRPG